MPPPPANLAVSFYLRSLRVTCSHHRGWQSEVNKVYDPPVAPVHCCSKFVKVLGHDKVRQGFFGQEVNLTALQPVPNQHVPARRQFREIRHRPWRYAD